jgi:hypothetical protein
MSGLLLATRGWVAGGDIPVAVKGYITGYDYISHEVPVVPFIATQPMGVTGGGCALPPYTRRPIRRAITTRRAIAGYTPHKKIVRYFPHKEPGDTSLKERYASYVKSELAELAKDKWAPSSKVVTLAYAVEDIPLPSPPILLPALSPQHLGSVDMEKPKIPWLRVGVGIGIGIGIVILVGYLLYSNRSKRGKRGKR